MRPARRSVGSAVARVVLLAAMLLLTVAAPAGAHVGGVSGVSDFRTEVLDGGDDCLTWRVLGDGSVSLRSDCAGTAVVLGYEDEPYVELSATGARENRNSPATYLNRDVQATTAVPPTARADAEPVWVAVGDEPERRWHDHRIHWMSAARPSLDGDGPARVGEWTIPVRLSDGPDGAVREVAASGVLWYDPPTTAWLPIVLAGIVVLAVSGSVIPRGGRRRWWPVPALLGVVAAGTVVMAGEELARAAREGRLDPTAVAVAAVVLVVAAAAVWRSIAGDEIAGYAAMAAGAALCWGYGWVDRGFLESSYLPGSLPATPLRTLVALQLLAPVAPVVAVLSRRRLGEGGTGRPGASPALLLLVVVAVAAAVLGRAEPAWAHAGLAGTVPAEGALLDAPPARIELRFTEPVDPVAAGVRLVRRDGTDVELASVGRIDGNPATVALTPAQPLSDGVHVVAWRVTSADSHPIRGAFTFTVGGEASSVESAESVGSLVAQLLADDGDVPGAAGLLASGRGVSYAGGLLTIGWLLFVRLRLTERAPLRAVAVAAGVGAAGTAVMVAAQAVVLRGSWGAAVDPGGWADVAATRSGRWWVARLAVAGAIAVAATLLNRRAGDRAAAGGFSGVGALLAAVALAVVTAFGGHAATGRWPVVGVVATVAHLLALGVWAAGLLSLATGRADLARRFSPVALGAVGVLAVSGTLNAARQVGSVDLLWSTGYGQALVVKVAVVGVAVAVAAVSRRRVRREPDDPRLVRSVTAEMGLLVVALAVTTVLVAARPAIAERSVIGEASAVVGDRVAQVVLEPAQVGGAALHVYLTSPRGALDQAEEITVSATLDERDIGPLSLPVFPAGPNHVTNPAAVLPVAGTWTIEIVARYGEFEEVRFRTTLAVREAP